MLKDWFSPAARSWLPASWFALAGGPLPPARTIDQSHGDRCPWPGYVLHINEKLEQTFERRLLVLVASNGSVFVGIFTTGRVASYQRGNDADVRAFVEPLDSAVAN